MWILVIVKKRNRNVTTFQRLEMRSMHASDFDLSLGRIEVLRKEAGRVAAAPIEREPPWSQVAQCPSQEPHQFRESRSFHMSPLEVVEA